MMVKPIFDKLLENFASTFLHSLTLLHFALQYVGKIVEAIVKILCSGTVVLLFVACVLIWKYISQK